MADHVSDLFDEFRRRAEAGEQPLVANYLERAGEPPETLAAVRALAAGEPTLLAQRAQRGVKRQAVIDALMGRLSLPTESRPKVEQRYHELEAGLLEAHRVDGGVLDAIASALGILRSHLVFGRPSAPQQPAYLRMPPGETTTSPLRQSPPVEPVAAAPAQPDEVDRLFGVGH
jgi:hypothetical protein